MFGNGYDGIAPVIHSRKAFFKKKKYVNQWGCISIEEMSKGKVKTIVHLYRYHTIKPHDRGLVFFSTMFRISTTKSRKISVAYRSFLLIINATLTLYTKLMITYS